LVALVLVWPALLVGVAWGALALWFDGPAERWLAGLLAGGLAIGCVALLTLVRPFGRGVIAVLLALAAVIAWWLAIPRDEEEKGNAKSARRG
jgi:hypothetical protein